MAIVARDLSDACGLAVLADRIWTGGGCIGLGMVFKGQFLSDKWRTPEDDVNLKKLEYSVKASGTEARDHSEP